MKVLGHDYKIVQSGNESSIGAFGRVHFDQLFIQVAEDLHSTQMQSTLLHEAIEALNYHLDLGLEHNVIMALEAGLFQVLTDNGISLDGLLKNTESKTDGQTQS